jgi:hypothetical protein
VFSRAAPAGFVECEVAGARYAARPPDPQACAPVLPPSVSPSVRPHVLASLRACATPKRVLTAPCGLRDAEEWSEDHCARAGIPSPCCNAVRDSRYGLRCALRDWRLEACSRVSDASM